MISNDKLVFPMRLQPNMVEPDPAPEMEVGPPGIGVAEMMLLLVAVGLGGEDSRLVVALLAAVGVSEKRLSMGLLVAVGLGGRDMRLAVALLTTV